MLLFLSLYFSALGIIDRLPSIDNKALGLSPFLLNTCRYSLVPLSSQYHCSGAGEISEINWGDK